METTSTLAAALYQRVSATDQSIGRQYEENRAAVARHGWQPVEYADPGLSASRFAGRNGGASRENWGRLLADIAAGRVDVLVLWEASRGDRQLAGWATLLDTCRRHGVRIYITSQDHLYDLSRAREWRTLAEDGIDSAYESEKLSMRIQSGKDSGARAGRPQGSIAYGIHRVRDPEKTRQAFLRDEADPVTGPVAARIIREVGKGRGYGEIAAGLDADAVAPPGNGRKDTSGRWHAVSIARIAANPVYATAGVVTAAESLAARARVTDTRRQGEKPAVQRFRYSSVIACGVCGGLLRGKHKSGRDRYACRQGHVLLPAAAVDAWVDALCTERLSRPDAIEMFSRADDEAAAAARTEAAAWRQRITDAAASYAAGRIPIAALEAVTAQCQPKAEAAGRRARDAAMPTALAGLPDADRAMVTRRWASLTLPARKAALRCLAPGAVALPARRGHHTPMSERVILWPEQP